MKKISTFSFLRDFIKKTGVSENQTNYAGNQFRLGTHNSVLSLRFCITEHCNYNCIYCNYPKKKRKIKHAFDFFSVEKWVESFSLIAFDYVLAITGGESFLDAKRFLPFLEGITSLQNCKVIRIDTNGSCLPRINFLSAGLKEKIRLNISYHPSQIKFNIFSNVIDEIVNSGWHIDMINYVMEVSQEREYEGIRDYFKKRYDIYVNTSPDTSDMNKIRQRKICNKYISKRDLLQKTGLITFGKRCFFPSIGYILNPDGLIYRACTKKDKINFIGNGNMLKPKNKLVRCHKFFCICLDMYAFLEDFSNRGQSLNLLREYVDANSKYQKTLAISESIDT